MSTPRAPKVDAGAMRPWYAVGFLSRLGSPFWIVCRDRFAGRDYLTTPTGKRRRFMSEATARAAIFRATNAEAAADGGQS